MNSQPYSAAMKRPISACSSAEGGAAGGGRVRAGAATPVARMKASKPAGAYVTRYRAGCGEVTTKPCCSSRGPKTTEPGPATIVRPPIVKVISPSSTYQDSSSRWCTCRGTGRPGG